MNIIHLQRAAVAEHLKKLNRYDSDLIYKFLHDYLLKDTGINVIRLRLNGIDGISSEIPDTSIHSTHKHWNADWIYVIDHKWTLKGPIPIETKIIIKDEKI